MVSDEEPEAGDVVPDRARCEQAMLAQHPRQPPEQDREDRSIRPVQVGLGVGSAQHGDFHDAVPGVPRSLTPTIGQATTAGPATGGRSCRAVWLWSSVVAAVEVILGRWSCGTWATFRQPPQVGRASARRALMCWSMVRGVARSGGGAWGRSVAGSVTGHVLQRGETDVSVIYTSSIEPAAPCSRPAEVAGVDQPLFAVSARFPLGLGTFAVPRSPAGMSGQGLRPFGLRFATVIDRAAAPLPGWSYCPIRQMAVATDDCPPATARHHEQSVRGVPDRGWPAPVHRRDPHRLRCRPDRLAGRLPQPARERDRTAHARHDGLVTSVDIDPDLIAEATTALAEVGYRPELYATDGGQPTRLSARAGLVRPDHRHLLGRADPASLDRAARTGRAASRPAELRRWARGAPQTSDGLLEGGIAPFTVYSCHCAHRQVRPNPA